MLAPFTKIDDLNYANINLKDARRKHVADQNSYSFKEEIASFLTKISQSTLQEMIKYLNKIQKSWKNKEALFKKHYQRQKNCTLYQDVFTIVYFKVNQQHMNVWVRQEILRRLRELFDCRMVDLLHRFYRGICKLTENDVINAMQHKKKFYMTNQQTLIAVQEIEVKLQEQTEQIKQITKKQYFDTHQSNFLEQISNQNRSETSEFVNNLSEKAMIEKRIDGLLLTQQKIYKLITKDKPLNDSKLKAIKRFEKVFISDYELIESLKHFLDESIPCDLERLMRIFLFNKKYEYLLEIDYRKRNDIKTKKYIPYEDILLLMYCKVNRDCLTISTFYYLLGLLAQIFKEKYHGLELLRKRVQFLVAIQEHHVRNIIQTNQYVKIHRNQIVFQNTNILDKIKKKQMKKLKRLFHKKYKTKQMDEKNKEKQRQKLKNQFKQDSDSKILIKMQRSNSDQFESQDQSQISSLILSLSQIQSQSQNDDQIQDFFNMKTQIKMQNNQIIKVEKAQSNKIQPINQRKFQENFKNIFFNSSNDQNNKEEESITFKLEHKPQKQNKNITKTDENTYEFNSKIKNNEISFTFQEKVQNFEQQKDNTSFEQQKVNTSFINSSLAIKNQQFLSQIQLFQASNADSINSSIQIQKKEFLLKMEKIKGRNILQQSQSIGNQSCFTESRIQQTQTQRQEFHMKNNSGKHQNLLKLEEQVITVTFCNQYLNFIGQQSKNSPFEEILLPKVKKLKRKKKQLDFNLMKNIQRKYQLSSNKKIKMLQKDTSDFDDYLIVEEKIKKKIIKHQIQ